MEQSTEKIRRRYNRIAGLYDVFEQPMEKIALEKWRLDIMKELEGKILEVGVGTGKNIQYYPNDADITAIDFSEKMLKKAQEKATQLNKKVHLIEMDAQNMDFPNNTFDTIFTTCVFCSVPDPIKGFQEIRRVCKPGGKIILIEHVRSEKIGLGLLMDVLNPLVVRLYGANINRRTVNNIYQSGYTDVEVTNLAGDIVKKIVIHNEK